MFAEDDDEAEDIFAATPTDVKEKEAAAAAQAGQAALAAAGARRGLLDNYDDAEGYYNFQVGRWEWRLSGWDEWVGGRPGGWVGGWVVTLIELESCQAGVSTN
jgi:hypothetical protein